MMVTNHKRFLWLCLFVFAALFAGCSPGSAPPGPISIGSAVDGVNYSYHYWREGLAFLIWHDLSYGSEGCSGIGSADDSLYRLECNVQAQDGRRLQWKAHTADGLTADFWIEDQSYDLSDGAMFLVSSGEGGLQVEQLKRDFSVLEPSDETVSGMATGDPDVARFIATVGAAGDSPEDGELHGRAMFEDALRLAGYSVEPGRSLDQPFFSVPGQVIVVDGQDVQVFEYPDSAAAQADAALIAPDASSVGTSMMTWVATPHFYAKDRLIVLYVGDNEQVIAALAVPLGDPIAQGQAAVLPPTAEPPAGTVLSYEPAVYRNEADNFELSYPASWDIEESVLGSRASGAQFYLNGQPIFSATIFLWDPKNDLDAYGEQRKLGWSSSSTVVSEEELTLPDGRRAIQYEIQGPDGSVYRSLLAEVGQNYLELSGPTDLIEFAEIAQTLRFLPGSE